MAASDVHHLNAVAHGESRLVAAHRTTARQNSAGPVDDAAAADADANGSNRIPSLRIVRGQAGCRTTCCFFLLPDSVEAAVFVAEALEGETEAGCCRWEPSTLVSLAA